MKKIRFLCEIIILVFLIFGGCNKKERAGNFEYKKTIDEKIKKIKAIDEITYLKNKINTFYRQEGRYPNSLNELVEKGYIENLPNPPSGTEFIYDSKTGSITIK